MSRLRSLALAALLLALPLGGCSAILGGLLPSYLASPIAEKVTERTPYIAAAEAFEVVRDTLKILGERELLTLDQLEIVDPLVQAVNTALNAWDKQLREIVVWRKAGLPQREAAAQAEADRNAILAQSGLAQLNSIKQVADLPAGVVR